MRIAVCTSFPNNYWELCAAEMLASFKANFPEDIKIFVQVDEQTQEQFHDINNKIVTLLDDRGFIASAWDDEQRAFLERWKDHKPESYMFDVVRFSHKIFALQKCSDALDEFDYLIWLDSDVITKKTITYEWLKEVLPQDDEVVSYLGRPYVGYSECGWVAYNLKAGGRQLLNDMRQMYIDDSFKNLKGWTDCHVLDHNLIGKKTKNLSGHCTKDNGLDVWLHTKLAEKMVHRKGDRKLQVVKARQNPQISDLNNLKIQTKNCLDHGKIRENIRKNITKIRNWATIVKPTNQEIVICAAGPSLIHHIDEIKKQKENGNFIITVKHAIETLKAHGVKPDACVLLDPRGHVEKFVREPETDVIYFVASMVDPSVVETLTNNKCTIIGYHAAVNAGEAKELCPADIPIAGGSATSTRTIHLFADMFGYKNFHLYGYDLCHYKRPEKMERDEDGNIKIFEETFKVLSYGAKQAERTFWTEGQFLAQAQELRSLYKDRKDITMNIYGDGLAGWMIKHQKLHDKYIEEYNKKVAEVRTQSINLREFLNAATRANEFSRRVS